MCMSDKHHSKVLHSTRRSITKISHRANITRLEALEKGNHSRRFIISPCCTEEKCAKAPKRSTEQVSRQGKHVDFSALRCSCFGPSQPRWAQRCSWLYNGHADRSPCGSKTLFLLPLLCVCVCDVNRPVLSLFLEKPLTSQFWVRWYPGVACVAVCSRLYRLSYTCMLVIYPSIHTTTTTTTATTTSSSSSTFLMLRTPL